MNTKLSKISECLEKCQANMVLNEQFSDDWMYWFDRAGILWTAYHVETSNMRWRRMRYNHKSRGKR